MDSHKEIDMPKKIIPNCPAIPAKRTDRKQTLAYDIELVTPMFGGGAVAGTPDSTLPIRPTAIRGHLRMWWRLTLGQKLGLGMWRREEEVFGSTEFPSPLTVMVEPLCKFQTVEPTYGERFGPIAYALFSAVENKQQVVREGGRFRMHISWLDTDMLNRQRATQNRALRAAKKKPLPDRIEDIGPDIEAAIAGWLAFGGLGARTRRGCGSVSCEQFDLSKLPAISADVFIGPKAAFAMEAWKSAVEAYRFFRQTPRGPIHQKAIKTKDGTKTIRVPGRSYWPEADSIRLITGCSLKSASHSGASSVPPDQNPHDHSTPIVPNSALPSFPRALLGLPINFHFADGPGRHVSAKSNKDPKDVQILPVLLDVSGKKVRMDRMCSPVITRPLQVNREWHPAVIVFKQDLPTGVGFELIGTNAMANGQDLAQPVPLPQVVNHSLASVRPMKGKSSAIDAFISYLQSNQFVKVQI